MTRPPGQVDVLAHELSVEQAHVDRVYAALDSAVAAARQVDAESREKFRTDRADWHREEAGTALFERDAFAYQAARRLAFLDAEHEGLVFGRLDLHPAETRYIGRLGLLDADYEPLVIDWRAPAAESFYRATAVDPMGVVRRRVLRCENERVVGIEDDLLDSADAPDDIAIVGEGALMAALGRARGPRMRDIVATIQAEQDEAIRAPYQGVTLIAGGPGTGKTVVALHRAAYLLYTHRARLENGGVLVVGPSSIFMRYIERVLPGLGEDSVQLRSIGDVACDVLGYGSDENEPAQTAALKGSLAMLPVLRRLVGLPLLEPEEAQVLRVAVGGDVLTLKADELAAIRARVLGAPRAKANRVEPAASALLDALWAKAVRQHDTDRSAFNETVTTQASWQMFLHAWWPSLTPGQALARLTEPRVMARAADGLLDPDQQELLGASLRRAVAGTRPAWTIADIGLLDELANLLGPVAPVVDADRSIVLGDDANYPEVVTIADILTDHRSAPDLDQDQQDTFAHVLVDEAQDVTPMQWRMLRRRGPQASWTLVGDPAQSSYPRPAETDRAVRDLIGHAPSRTFRLSTNYRSPAEVFDLARRYILRFFPQADVPTAVRSTGVQPELLTTDHLEAELDVQVARLCAQVDGSVAVVVPPSLFDGLAEQARAGRWHDPDDPERVSVLTALQAKGMEYDGVVVVSPDDIVAQAGERVLYVDLTRATQRLVTIDLGGRPGRWREGL